MGVEFLEPAPPISYTEQFKAHFPFYLSIGMTYDQYWNDDCELVIYYRKAHNLQLERKNQELWLQGFYIYDALCCVSPVLHAFAKKGTKPLPYPQEPYPITKEEVKEIKEAEDKLKLQQAKAKFAAWANKLDKPVSLDGEVRTDG